MMIKKKMKGFLRFLIWFMSSAIFFCICIAMGLCYLWSSNLPHIDSLREYSPPTITESYGDDREAIGRFWDEKRIVVPIDNFLQHLVNAFVAAEDSNFFEHEGVDLFNIFRALIKNLKAGRIEQGGSTITQQVTRSLLLRNTEKIYKRKAREALLSLQLERNFSKSISCYKRFDFQEVIYKLNLFRFFLSDKIIEIGLDILRR